MVFISLITLIVLYADDIRVTCLDPSLDIGVDYVILVCFFVFLIEMII